MAKSRIRSRGCTRGRLRRKRLGKGCSARNAKVKARLPKRVHMKFPVAY